MKKKKEEAILNLMNADKELLRLGGSNLFEFAKYDSIHLKIMEVIDYLESTP